MSTVVALIVVKIGNPTYKKWARTRATWGGRSGKGRPKGGKKGRKPSGKKAFLNTPKGCTDQVLGFATSSRSKVFTIIC